VVVPVALVRESRGGPVGLVGEVLLVPISRIVLSCFSGGTLMRAPKCEPAHIRRFV
jgi:hypothetical protein